MAAYREVFCEREGDSLGRKEGCESAKNGLRIFLHNEMPRLADASLHRRGPAAPDLCGAATFGGESMRAIEQAERSGDLFSGGFIRLIQRAIKTGSCAVICTHGMNPRGVQGLGAVTVESCGGKGRKTFAQRPLRQSPIHISDRVRPDHPFWQGGRLGQKRPMIGGHCKICGPACPEIGCRHNFDNAQLAQPLWMCLLYTSDAADE